MITDYKVLLYLKYWKENHRLSHLIICRPNINEGLTLVLISSKIYYEVFVLIFSQLMKKWVNACLNLWISSNNENAGFNKRAVINTLWVHCLRVRVAKEYSEIRKLVISILEAAYITEKRLFANIAVSAIEKYFSDMLMWWAI